MGKGLPLMSCCLSAQVKRDEQGQPVFLLSARGNEGLRKEMSRRCLGYRIVWL